jgi:hypothetical protein
MKQSRSARSTSSRIRSGIELDVEGAVDVREGVATVLVALRHDSFGGRASAHRDPASLGVEVEGRERAAGEPGEDEILGSPVLFGMRRLAPVLADGVFESSRSHSGQRVMTTFFSV